MPLCRVVLTLTMFLVPVVFVRAERPEVSSSSVQLTSTEGGGHQLLRNGQHYVIRGVGGQDRLDLFKRLGGNSIRTWGTDGLQRILDDAHQRGLTVCVGFWLGHERHGFNYADETAVLKQLDACISTVKQFKSHPAVLLWAIGNEMEGAGTNPAVWYAIDHIAREVKRIDPNHPTLTVIAELGDHKVQSLHRFCPHIDIVGINSYGGIATVADRYRKAGGIKPYIISEHGPPGPWEVSKTGWGAPIEPTSSAKAVQYSEGYRQAVAEQADRCLGSYSFLWGNKQETTATWFGMLLGDGTRLGPADAMSKAWTGRPVSNRCPVINELKINASAKLGPGQVLKAEAIAGDTEGDPLEYQWVLRADAVTLGNGNDAQSADAEFADAVTSNGPQAQVQMPAGGGGYRLFVYVRDSHGGGAVANVPLFIDAPVKLVESSRPKLPLVVYGDNMLDEAYTPAGYMGRTDAISMDLSSKEAPHLGATCLRVDYSAIDNWGGVAWQSPPNDWKGAQPGGFDLSEATALEFWARGKAGGERVTFLVGLNTTEGPYRDTGKAELPDVQLTTEWKQYRIPLESLDRHRIKAGFGWSLAGQGRPITFYLDNVQYVK